MAARSAPRSPSRRDRGQQRPDQHETDRDERVQRRAGRIKAHRTPLGCHGSALCGALRVIAIRTSTGHPATSSAVGSLARRAAVLIDARRSQHLRSVTSRRDRVSRALHVRSTSSPAAGVARTRTPAAVRQVRAQRPAATKLCGCDHVGGLARSAALGRARDAVAGGVSWSCRPPSLVCRRQGCRCLVDRHLHQPTERAARAARKASSREVDDPLRTRAPVASALR